MPAINGRPVVSRADMVASGVGRSTIDAWYRERETTGFPEKAGQIGLTDYWYADEWTAFLTEHRERKRAELTEVDRSGDPAELVDAGEAARIMGYAHRKVITSNVRLGYFPQPDGSETLPNGRSSPRWKRSTVWAAADARTGKGGPRSKGTPRPSKPHPYAGDPRLIAVRARLAAGERPSIVQLAQEWGVSERTAGRILHAAENAPE